MQIVLLEKAFAFRKETLAREVSTNAYRLFCGEGEGISGLVIEIFPPLAIFQVHSGKFKGSDSDLKTIADWCGRVLGIEAVYLKAFVADRSREKENPKLKNATPFWGRECAPVLSILENGHEFEVHPYDGFSTGIFLDQRENRKRLAAEFAGRRVLNTFSYTCAFGVYCAKAGAQTTNVDLSRKYLEWGQRNYKLNGIEPSMHRFYIEDFFDYARKAAKRKETFDLIILDPPSFSRNKQGKVFALEKHFGKLIEASLPLMEKAGTLFFSNNLSEWMPEEFLNKVEKFLKGKRLDVKRIKNVPFDFQKSSVRLNAVSIKRKT